MIRGSLTILCLLVAAREKCLRKRYYDMWSVLSVDILKRNGRIEVSLRLIGNYEGCPVAQTLG